ncbi:hypothetical protein [Caballeronia catudaia]|nr:hypothetical protein [Caballeronia catudaia]
MFVARPVLDGFLQASIAAWMRAVSGAVSVASALSGRRPFA